MAAVHLYPAKCIENGRSRNARPSNPGSRWRRHHDSPRPLAPVRAPASRIVPGSFEGCGAIRSTSRPAPHQARAVAAALVAAGETRRHLPWLRLDRCSAVPANVEPGPSYGRHCGRCAASSKGWSRRSCGRSSASATARRPHTRRRCARAAERWGLYMFRTLNYE